MVIQAVTRMKVSFISLACWDRLALLGLCPLPLFPQLALHGLCRIRQYALVLQRPSGVHSCIEFTEAFESSGYPGCFSHDGLFSFPCVL